MNAIGAISSISGVSGISGISGVSGASGASSITGATAIPNTAIDGTTGAASSGDSFLNSLSYAFGSLNTQLTSADSSMANFASGGSADLQSVMLQMEESSVSLKSAVDVRDKLLEAYQEIMRTQL